MKQLKTIAVKLFSCFTLLFLIKNISIAQSCNGTWSLQRPATEQCVVGQWVGWQNIGEPSGCPINPLYIGTKSNTYTFSSAVNGFSIDFTGFDGIPFCPRMAIYVNGVFYPLTTTNLLDLPSGTSCTNGLFSNIVLTPDGYITESTSGGEGFIGKGRIIINNVFATSVTVSTDDGFGTVFSNPFNCLDVVPLQLINFSALVTSSCITKLGWQTGIEENIKSIEVQHSEDGLRFRELIKLLPKGSNSNYSLEAISSPDLYFRLKFIDQDGNYQFSKIIQVRSNCNKSSYSITPNPSTGMINITGLSGNEKILIYDMAGKNVLSFAEPFTNTYNINKLSGGLYVVAIFQGKICKAQLKLVKTGFD